jgi:hypothetical protein
LRFEAEALKRPCWVEPGDFSGNLITSFRYGMCRNRKGHRANSTACLFWLYSRAYNKGKVGKKSIKPQVPEGDKWGDFRTFDRRCYEATQNAANWV